MSEDAREIHARFDSFARQFLRPLLAGGNVVAGRPVSPGMLEHFAFARPADSEVDAAIYGALHAAASDIAPVRTIPWPDRGLAAVAMACHDLVAITDPLLDRWLARRSRPQMLEWVDWFLEQAGPPRTRGAALARHAVVSRALSLRRRDVVVKNWAYTYRFFGRPVPPRVVAMPKLRAVKRCESERSVTTLWDELDEELGTAPRVRTLLSRSPVTELLSTERVPNPSFGTALLAVLSDDLVRSGLARALVAQGDRVASPLGWGLRELAGRNPPPRMLFYVIALIYEMHVIAALDARTDELPRFARPADADAQLFAAVLPAMLGAPDDLGALLDLDPDDLAHVRRIAPELDRAAGRDASRYAVSLIDRAMPPRLDHERDAIPQVLPTKVGT